MDATQETGWGNTWLLQSTFTVSAREKSLERIIPTLAALVRPGDEILDLCCSSGFVSFWFEAQGTPVTAVDFAPYMIAPAKAEAGRRHSTVQFVEADIFVHDFGQGRFDLISCFGNSISDFPLLDFAGLAQRKTFCSLPGAIRFLS